MTSGADDCSIAYFLMRQRGALRLHCNACGHDDRWGSQLIARAVGRRGLGAKLDDLIRRLKCSQCNSDNLRADQRGDDHGFACMHHLPEPERWAAFDIWLDRVLGPPDPPSGPGLDGRAALGEGSARG